MTRNVGAPDWQRGVVNADIRLATVPGGTQSVTVTIPPNAKTMVVVYPYGAVQTSVEVKGVTTGMGYSGQLRPADVGIDYADSFVFYSVSSVLDDQLTIKMSAAPNEPWYVYTTTGVYATNSPVLEQVVQSASAYFGVGLMVAGYDGNAIEVIEMDSFGAVAIAGPNLSSGVVAFTTTGSTLLNTSTAYYQLYAVDVMNMTATAESFTIALVGGSVIAAGVVPPNDSKTIDLGRFSTRANVLGINPSGTLTGVLRYVKGLGY